MVEDKSIDLESCILNLLRGAEDGRTMKLKTLRKEALMASYQLSEKEIDSDKDAKKKFKKEIKALEESGKLELDADGTISLSREEIKNHKKLKKEKKRKNKDHKEGDSEGKKAKRDKSRREEKSSIEELAGNEGEEEIVDDKNHEPANDKAQNDANTSDKNSPCQGNPTGCTRLFLGNLPFAVNEESLKEHFTTKGAEVTHIKWITDKTDGRFYGSAFIEMGNSSDAATAMTMVGEKLMGRPLKINYAPARPGDIWPPENKGAGGVTQARGKGKGTMSEKPEGCTKLFVGNLSYEIDDDAIFKFFASVDAEVKAVRWIHHKDSGDFKGIGFVEFWTTDACDKAATLNGKNLLDRPIRIDWTD